MIEVRYQAQLGNQLFQYCFGRILAEGLGYRLNAGPVEPFAGTAAPVEGAAFETPVWDCPEEARLGEVFADRAPRRIVVSGYMQNYRYYRGHREKIREWLALGPSKEQPEPGALVVHIRLGDYWKLGWVLSLKYYHSVIEQEKFSRLYIVTDEPNSPFLKSFARYKPVLVTGSPIGSLRFIRAARRIVLSQSTYGWWGAYLSDADRIYFPVPKTSLWSTRSRVDLRVDEPRYIYVTGVDSLKKVGTKSVDAAEGEQSLHGDDYSV